MANLRFIWGNKIPRLFFLGGFALFLVTAFYNVGIIALDDYAFIIAQVVPAQTVKPTAILANNGLWFPLYPWLLHKVSTLALQCGVTDPYRQLQCVLVVIALITFPMFSILSVGFFRTSKQKTLALFLVCFYFACPLFFTRPMIETMSAPFILLSCYFATLYWNKGAVKHLVAAVCVLAVAALFRYQSGVCGLALVFLVGARRDWRGLGTLLLVGLGCFWATGRLDEAMSGEFHHSLKGYLDYNLHYGLTHHGRQPLYVFFSLFVALSIPPVFFAKYKNLKWKEIYLPLVPLLSYFLVFLFAHSLVPHKEERFMIPVLVPFLMLLVPLADYLTREGYSHWRVKTFLGVNFLILPLACFNIPQKNILGLVRYLHRHGEIQNIVAVEESLALYPKAFTDRAVPESKLAKESLETLSQVSCGTAVVIREEYMQGASPYLAGMVESGAFAPALLEKIFVVLNPKYNRRRETIRLFEKKDCPS